MEATSLSDVASLLMRAQSLVYRAYWKMFGDRGVCKCCLEPNLQKMTSQCGGIGLISCQTYRNARYRVHVVPILPRCPVPALMLYRYRYRLRYMRAYRYCRYRYWCRTELTEGSGTGVEVVPNLPEFPVSVLIGYRTYRSIRYRYCRRTELTEVSGTGAKVCNGTAGTGIDVVPT